MIPGSPSVVPVPGSPSRLGPSSAGNRRGFGIIEAVVALVLLGVILASLIPAMTHYMRINTAGELRTGAVAAAQQELDALRALETWPASGSQRSVAVGNAVYTATLSYQQYCDADGCHAGARRVHMEVTHDGRSLYQVETVFTQLDA